MRIFIALIIFIFSLQANASSPERVIAIGGAITEIVYALGAEKKLVGSDTTSYYPEKASQLPKVGYQRALSSEGVLSLNPDLVIMTNEAGPKTIIKQVESAGVKTLTLKPGRSIADIKTNIIAIGKELNLKSKADELISRINEEEQKLSAIISNLNKPKIMFILQHGASAPMVAGSKTAADSIIKLSGASNVVSDYNGYKPLTPEAAVTLNPDFILITNQGIQQAGGIDSIKKIPGLALTPAAKKGHIIAMDSLLLLGFGPRTVQAAIDLNNAYKQL